MDYGQRFHIVDHLKVVVGIERVELRMVVKAAD